jgi:5'-3' exonuclease
MGVLKFQQWLRNTFENYYKLKLEELTAKKVVGRLFIDFNAVIHNAINEVYKTDDPEELERMFTMSPAYWTGPGGVLDGIMDELLEMIRIVKPTRLVYIAADGPVMKAKLMQQRQRSYKAQGDTQPFNRNQVKPGTDFMTTICGRVRQALKEWATAAYKNNKPRPHEIHLSDSGDEGEGEHKIMTQIGIVDSNARGANNEIDVIYSPDSDMHFLSYLHSTRNTIIMRRLHEIQNDAEKYEYFHVTEIKKLIIKSPTKNFPDPLGFGDIRDFVLVSCFGGNDFVPALPFAKFGDGNAFDAIVKAYKRAFGNRSGSALYVDNKINWLALAHYLSFLEVESTRFLQKAAIDQVKRSYLYHNEEAGEDRRSPVLKWALLETGDEMELNPVFFNTRYKKYIFGTFHEPNMVRESFNFDATEEQVHNYLEGLTWVMSYYASQGSSVNHDWAYVFHYPPDVSDIRKYLLKRGAKPTWTQVPLDHTHQDINTPLEHLITILRRDELWMLPPIVSTLFLQEMPDLFPEKVYVDKTGIPFGVEGKEIVLVNFPSMTQIRQVFDIIREDPSVVRVNKVRKNATKIWPSRGGRTK